MPEDKKKRSKKQQQPTDSQQAAPQAEKPEQESARGNRGELGVATPGLKVRQMWHEAHFERKDVGDKHNPRKRVWVPVAGPRVSLKKFVRELAKSGNEDAKAWLSNKRGANNAKRSDKTIARIAAEKMASKAARRKRGEKSRAKTGGDGTAATTAAAATATVTKGKKK